jgi:hypothetical protein
MYIRMYVCTHTHTHTHTPQGLGAVHAQVIFTHIHTYTYHGGLGAVDAQVGSRPVVVG